MQYIDHYCKAHDEALCIACVPTRHKTCTDIIPIEDAVRGCKDSIALVDLEVTVSELLCNISKILKERERVVNNYDQQKGSIIVQIRTLRSDLNNHLDRLEQSPQRNRIQTGNFKTKVLKKCP